MVKLSLTRDELSKEDVLLSEENKAVFINVNGAPQVSDSEALIARALLVALTLGDAALYLDAIGFGGEAGKPRHTRKRCIHAGRKP